MAEAGYLDNKKFSKYFGEQSSWHDGELVWPGYDGIPALKKYVNDKTVRFYTLYSFFHSKKFDLEDEEEVKYYQWVRDRIANGWFLGSKLELRWDDSGLKAYMEWVQRYVIPVEANIQELPV